MATTQLDYADRIAMYIGGGLLVLAIPVMGVLNLLAGNESPLYTYEVTSNGAATTGHVLAPDLAPKGATIVASPLFDPNLRAYIAAAGMIIFAAYFVYRLFVPAAREAEDDATTATIS